MRKLTARELLRRVEEGELADGAAFFGYVLGCMRAEVVYVERPEDEDGEDIEEG